MDDLLKRAAEQMGMPPALTERSAQARAEKEGTTVEAVLAEWAGEDVGSTPEPQAAEAQAPESETSDSDAPAADAPATGAPNEVTTDYLVDLAAASKRMPPKLVRSSAEARARNSGTDLDTVLASWAGVDLDELSKQVADGTAPVPDVEPADSRTTATSEPATPDPGTPEPVDAEDAAAPAASEPSPAPAATAAAGAAGAMSMDELLDKVAEAKGMPAPIAKRSAEARAKKTGEPLEAVLAEWAGIDPSAVSATEPEQSSSTPAASEPAASEPSPAPAATAAAGAAGAMSMDELLDKVAEAKGMPAPIAKRSAEARAKKTGEPLEAVLAEWAGVDPATVAPADSGAPAAQAPAPEAPAAAPAAATEDVPEIEVIEGTAPAEDEPRSETDDDEGSRSRGYPAWLAAAFVIIPILAVTYILVTPNGPDCGVAGQLRIDEATGLAVNCDGSEYGSSSVDFLALGSGQYSGCVACHGGNGEGGVGPAFTGGAVLATFPTGTCDEHVEWIRLGTSGWPEDTYGATNKPVGGGGNMPAFGNLTDEQLAAVALYERVQFGGQPLEEAEADCGLVEGEGDGSEGGDEMVEAGS